MDENILTNESREEDDGRIVKTPNTNLKNLNCGSSINQINSAGFTNQPEMKKIKNSSKMATAKSSTGKPTQMQLNN